MRHPTDWCSLCGEFLVETFSDEKRVVTNCRGCGTDRVSDSCSEVLCADRDRIEEDGGGRTRSEEA